jgi:hypothetical protein
MRLTNDDRPEKIFLRGGLPNAEVSQEYYLVIFSLITKYLF